MAENRLNIGEDEEEPTKKSGGSFMESHKVLTLVLAMVLSSVISIALSLTFAALLLSPSQDPSQMVSVEDFELAQQEITQLREQVAAHEASVRELNAAYPVMQTYLRHSSSTALKNILIDQEKNAQSFLLALKAGMRDLAFIVSGSRDWLTDYSDQMDRAIQHSIQREELLRMLKTGDPAAATQQ